MLSTLDYANIGVTALAVVSYMFVLYVALKVRQSLAVGSYKRHALGMGLIALIFAADQVRNSFPAMFTGIWNYLGGLIGIAWVLVLLYWVDSSILAARRSDPLYRDTFHWSKLRWVAWVASVVVIIFGNVTGLVLSPASSSTVVPVVQASPELNLLLAVSFFLPAYIVVISAVVVIPFAANRCKDLVFRKHLEWFFLFLAIQLIMSGGLGFLFQSLYIVIDGTALMVGLYPLYRSVKSLVPLYKFSTEEKSLAK